MSRTKLEELRRKQQSYSAIGKYTVGTGLWSYETEIRIPLDSPTHSCVPIEDEWFREAISQLWDSIQERIKQIAEADLAKLKYDAIIEAGEFLKEYGKT